MRVNEVRDFSKRGDALPIPNLIRIQSDSYQRFLQKDVEPAKRKNEGLEALLREVFPIERYDGNLRLEYVSYALAERAGGYALVPKNAAVPPDQAWTAAQVSVPGEEGENRLEAAVAV